MSRRFLPPSGVRPAITRNQPRDALDTPDMNELKTREPGAILVVEDDDVFAAGFIRWLRRRHGFDRFEILVAPSEEEAIRALRQSRRFCGFIVDWRLGSTLTAERVLEHIRQLYPSRRTPVYVATSHALGG